MKTTSITVEKRTNPVQSIFYRDPKNGQTYQVRYLWDDILERRLLTLVDINDIRLTNGGVIEVDNVSGINDIQQLLDANPSLTRGLEPLPPGSIITITV